MAAARFQRFKGAIIGNTAQEIIFNVAHAGPDFLTSCAQILKNGRFSPSCQRSAISSQRAEGCRLTAEG
jgi:hypothetical protein